MSRLYWDSQFKSPLFTTTTMDHNPLKRSRSTESLERQFKRSKPFQIESIASPLSVASEPSSIAPPTTTTTAYSNNILYPTHHIHPQQEQQQHYAFLKPISISTKTSFSAPPPPPPPPTLPPPQIALVQTAVTRTYPTGYENINGILYSVHVKRFGDPETRESWWQDSQDIEMEEEEEQDTISNNEYDSVNSVLRQAFLARRGR